MKQPWETSANTKASTATRQRPDCGSLPAGPVKPDPSLRCPRGGDRNTVLLGRRAAAYAEAHAAPGLFSS